MNPAKKKRAARLAPEAARDTAQHTSNDTLVLSEAQVGRQSPHHARSDKGVGAAMIADALLSRLDGVRQTGTDSWLARCPAHNDKRPSLSVREIDGDRVLVHCWAGCSVEEVLGAVGLSFDALYPERPSHRGKPERRPFPAADVLRAIENEALIAAVAASQLGNGGTLTDEDRGRLLVASVRITAAVRESGHARQ